MPDQNKDDTNANNGGGNDDDKSKTNTEIDPKVLEAADKLVEEKLKPIKESLNKAYAARDEAAAEAAKLHKAAQDAVLKRLENEGKLSEAAELRLKQEREAHEESKKELAASKERLVSLERDGNVRAAFGAYKFRNANASNFAFKAVVGLLSKNDKGEWVGANNATIEAVVASFAKDTDNEFLFEARPSSGGGSQNSKQSGKSEGGQSLFKLSQEEVLKRAAEGGLRNKRK